MLVQACQPAVFRGFVKSGIVLLKPFAKSISVSNSTALKVMLRSYRVIIFCNFTATPSKALFLVKPLGHCYDSQYRVEN